MKKTDARSKDKSIWRSAGSLTVSLEDKFRFTLVVCFIGLGLLGTGGLFYVSDTQAHKFNLEAAHIAVNRWNSLFQVKYSHLFQPQNFDSTEDEKAPALLEPNRLIPKQLLPEKIARQDVAFVTQANGNPLWVIGRHPVLEPGVALILSEKEYPELKIARESFHFQRWLVATLLLVLLGVCAALFLFNRHFVFRPLGMLREALLNRRLTDAARVKSSQKSKILIERLEEKSRFPLEQFDSDEFGQIALILEDQDRRQKALKEDWLKSFNTINEPIAIFGANGRLRHVNTAMDEFLDEIGIPKDLVENLNSHAFIASFLQLSEDIAKKLEKVLNQKYPRICSQACSIELPEGQRAFRYSISTISNHGERFAVFSLVREQLLGANQSLEDIILEQTNNQLKIIHRIQHTLRQGNPGKEDTVLHMCDSLTDNIHSLLEVSNTINPSLASHKIEFNLQHFFRDLQESMEGVFQLQLEFERQLPNFVVGDPTHLRQFLKGVFQSCQETSSVHALLMNVSYAASSRELVISISSHDASSVLRDPALNLFMSHYSPFLSLKSTAEDDLQPDEYLRIAIAAPAGMSRIEAVEFDITKRQLPSSLLVVSDDLIPDHMREVFEGSEQYACELLTPGEILEKELDGSEHCMLLFVNNNQQLREKNILKAINHTRAKNVPAILLSQHPRRGESITALRLGFVAYLTPPLEQDELQKLLILTMNESIRDSVGKLGLLTKHTVRDLIPSLGKVLIGNISKDEVDLGEQLAHTLRAMGFKVSEASTSHSFFEMLHKGQFEYVLCSQSFSAGLKRRIQASLKGTPCLVFGSDNGKADESKQGNQNQGIQWIRIEDTRDKEGIRAAFEAANAVAQSRGDLRPTTDEDETEDSDDSERTPYGIAI